MGAWIEMFLVAFILGTILSHPTMGAWIEISKRNYHEICQLRRTPRWVRGLKCSFSMAIALARLSHPTMGAWIEIFLPCIHTLSDVCRTPRWVRGLKSVSLLLLHSHNTGRTPRWVRGLKYSSITNARMITI